MKISELIIELVEKMANDGDVELPDDTVISISYGEMSIF